MTRDKDFKKLVRERQQQRGERYTQARVQLRSDEPARTAQPAHESPHSADADQTGRRILGIETKYSIVVHGETRRPIGADEAAQYLFRRVISWGRSSNVFLENGANLKLDESSLPDYATPECDTVHGVVVHDKAGERILADMARRASLRLREEGVQATITIHKAVPEATAGTGPSHENYLVSSDADFAAYAALIPFFVSRQCFVGAGHVLRTSRGATYCLSQRAEHIWTAGTSGPGGSRPILSTDDAPYADADRWRRLHVMVGDSNMSETASFLKLATTALLLHMVDVRAPVPDVGLENPIRAVREISHDVTCTRTVRLADGRALSAVQIQELYCSAARRHAERRGLPSELQQGLEMWERVLAQLQGNGSDLQRELDWALKLTLLEDHQRRHGVGLDDPGIDGIARGYHDVSETGAFRRLEEHGSVQRITSDADVSHATEHAPPTRAHLRSTFIREARRARRNYVVDWVHLKLADQAQRTILCKDPFLADDSRVARLLASLEQPPEPS